MTKRRIDCTSSFAYLPWVCGMVIVWLQNLRPQKPRAPQRRSPRPATICPGRPGESMDVRRGFPPRCKGPARPRCVATNTMRLGRELGIHRYALRCTSRRCGRESTGDVLNHRRLILGSCSRDLNHASLVDSGSLPSSGEWNFHAVA